MKVAFATWNNRIAPVFDVARQLHIMDTESGRIVREMQTSLPEEMPVQKALRLAQLGVETLVCGAISRPMYTMVTAYGVQVIPFVAGNLHEVMHAWMDGSIVKDLFSMPGCWGQGLRFQDGHGIDRSVSPVQARNRGRHRWRGRRGHGS